MCEFFTIFEEQKAWNGFFVGQHSYSTMYLQSYNEKNTQSRAGCLPSEHDATA